MANNAVYKHSHNGWRIEITELPRGHFAPFYSVSAKEPILGISSFRLVNKLYFRESIALRYAIIAINEVIDELRRIDEDLSLVGRTDIDRSVNRLNGIVVYDFGKQMSLRMLWLRINGAGFLLGDKGVRITRNDIESAWFDTLEALVAWSRSDDGFRYLAPETQGSAIYGEE